MPLPSFHFRLPASYLLFTFFYFAIGKSRVVVAVKVLSLALLYIILVWNRGRYDNDSFLLFYLVILLAHAAFPYLALQFMEKELAFLRNLPLSFFRRVLMFVLPYFILLLPELAYIIYHATALPVAHRFAYYLNLIASLFLLTAVQYSEAFTRDEYVKAVFGLFFSSIFALHVQAFWLWIGIQVIIGIVLFRAGYFAYEADRT